MVGQEPREDTKKTEPKAATTEPEASTGERQHLSSSSSWSHPRLTVLGLYYPLGPCQTRLPKSDLYPVLERLAHVFCTLSLHTQYQNSPISATCTSMDQVSLEVSLFEARDDSGQIILEIARRQGDSYLFHQYSRQIMAVATNYHSEAAASKGSPWNVHNLHLVDSVVTTQTTDDYPLAEALESVWSMLRGDRHDARKLALEALVHMTDPNKCGWSTAQAFCQSLLRPQDGIEEQLSRRILAYATMTSFSSQENEFIFLSGDEAYLGLRIVSQALQMAAQAKTMDVQSFLQGSDLVDCLMDHVSRVQTQPHHAFFAVQSLAAICDCVPALRSRVRVAHCLQEAQLVGESSHLALATVSEKLLVTLQA